MNSSFSFKTVLSGKSHVAEDHFLHQPGYEASAGLSEGPMLGLGHLGSVLAFPQASRVALVSPFSLGLSFPLCCKVDM